MRNFAHPLDLTRRQFLSAGGVGLGSIALAGLLGDSAWADDESPRLGTHHPARAKRVIHLFMGGGPSHLEMFDPKPKLTELEGKPLPQSVIGNQRFAFIRPDAAALGPRFRFHKHGQCGAELSEVLPCLAGVVDDLCIVRSLHSEQFNHGPAQHLLATGFAQGGRPSMGSWVAYGLGAETRELPAYLVLSTAAGVGGGPANWSNGFLPSHCGGVQLRNQGDPILYLSNPPGFDARLQRDSLDLAGDLNRRRLDALRDPAIAARIESYETAFRMQSSAPRLLDLSQETQQTLRLYGCEAQKPSFARACLYARRMVERGVRFVTIHHEGWDAHSDVQGAVRAACAETDRACAALIHDLKQRGLLDDTLVVWSGEFGRTPMVESSAAQGRKLGRDHHPHAFTAWLAGGGVRPGQTYGASDEFGWGVAEKPVHVHDLQATILHLLGLDHKRLTYRHAGRDFRLTDVGGRVVSDLCA